MAEYDDRVLHVANALVTWAYRPGVHPSIVAGCGAAFSVLGELSPDEVPDDDVFVESCRCLLQFTMAFSRHLSEEEMRAVAQDACHIAREIFGEEWTGAAQDLIQEEYEAIEEEYERCGGISPELMN